MLVCKYKFDSSIYADLIPEFNSEYTDYTVTDEVSGNIVTRTIECDILPTRMAFGNKENTNNKEATDRELSLLEVLDMNTSELTDLSYMFAYCKNLISVICEWDTSKVVNINSTFHKCENLITLDVSNWDTSNIIYFQQTFYHCYKLPLLDVSNWDTSKVTHINNFLDGCFKIQSLNMSNWDTSKMVNTSSMFAYCDRLVMLDISNFNLNSVSNINNMLVGNLLLKDIGMVNCDINTINKVGALTTATLWVGEHINIADYNGTAPIKTYREDVVEVKLNSPLLEGDSIEVIDGNLCHVHRWNNIILDGSQNMDGFSEKHDGTHAFAGFGVLGAVESNEECTMICESLKAVKGFAYDYWQSMIYMYYSDTYITRTRVYVHVPKNELISLDRVGFSKWLSENPVMAIYKLAEPWSENITPLQSEIVLRTFEECNMNIATNLPIKTNVSYRTNVPSITVLTAQVDEIEKSGTVVANLTDVIEQEIDK